MNSSPDHRLTPSVAARVLIVFVRLYQATLSQFLGGHCRFHPTCSRYAVTALTHHGAMRGGWLTLRRLMRCHPLGGAGYDPVPDVPTDDGSVHEDSHEDGPESAPDKKDTNV